MGFEVFVAQTRVSPLTGGWNDEQDTYLCQDCEVLGLRMKSARELNGRLPDNAAGLALDDPLGAKAHGRRPLGAIDEAGTSCPKMSVSDGSGGEGGLFSGDGSDSLRRCLLCGRGVRRQRLILTRLSPRKLTP